MEEMKAFLERLKVADPETLEEIELVFYQLEHWIECIDDDHEFEMDIQGTYERNKKTADDLIQGCCQRAIAAKPDEWDMSVWWKNKA